MKAVYYEEIFEVIETCRNGNERKIKKSVMCPIFRNGRHVVTADRVSKAEGVLRQEGYYNITHLGTKRKAILFAG